MRLCELEWRNTDLALERSPQVSFADTEILRELPNRLLVERTCCNAVRRYVREARDGIHERTARCELRTTTKTRPEASAFGSRRGLEEAAAVRIRNARGTHGPAVDAGRRDADEKQTVEPSITRA